MIRTFVNQADCEDLPYGILPMKTDLEGVLVDMLKESAIRSWEKQVRGFVSTVPIQSLVMAEMI